MNASVFRKTRFEIREIHQGPNSFGLVCTERGTRGRMPPLEVPEEAFTDEEMAQVHAVLELLENKFAPVYDAHVEDPERLKDLLVEAKEAEKRVASAKAEAALIEAENLVKRAELEEFDRNLATIRAEAAKKDREEP